MKMKMDSRRILTLIAALLINFTVFCVAQSSGCVDEYPTDACRTFQRDGGCSTDIGNFCKVTCNRCGGTFFGPPPPPAPRPQPPPMSRPQPPPMPRPQPPPPRPQPQPSLPHSTECADRDGRCGDWAASGFCATQSGIVQICKRSCNACISIPRPALSGWGAWEPFGQCSETCGYGTKTQYRSCNQVFCSGPASQTQSCFVRPCVTQPSGYWSIWGAFDPCTASCGEGTKTRYRSCVGFGCIGSSSSTESCVEAVCPLKPIFPVIPGFPVPFPDIPSLPDLSDFQRISGCSDYSSVCRTTGAISPLLCSDSTIALYCRRTCGKCGGLPSQIGILSKWSKWSSCSKTCKKGTRTRTRKCTGICAGRLKDTESCTVRKTCPPKKKPPPKKPMWSSWGPYSKCTEACGGGTKTRKRKCNYGNSCKGSSTSTVKCNVDKCSKRGWGSWSAYSECTRSCGGGTKTRTRKCHGIFCFPSSSSETTKCNVHKCSTKKGVWGSWTSYSTCTKTCGTQGTQYKTRKCKTKNCVGSSRISRKCNIKKCDTVPPPSGGWTTCTRKCGTGTQYQFDSSSCKTASNPRCLRTFQACNIKACPRKTCPRKFKHKYGMNYACCETAENNIQRIIGGDGADIKNWPWMVLVDGLDICGGSIIHKQWILTVAHCLSSSKFEQMRRTSVYVGIQRYSDRKKDGMERPINDVIVHPQFSRKTLLNDIALIKLKKTLEYKPTIKAVDLPFGEETPIDSTCFTTGWGVVDKGSTDPSEMLQKVSLQNFDMAMCRKRYKSGSNDQDQKDIIATSTKLLCAGSLTDNRDACYGDSGGPMVCQRCQACRWYLAGITSFGFPDTCGKKGYPGIYVKVKSYETWITKYVPELKRGRWSCPYKTGDGPY